MGTTNLMRITQRLSNQPHKAKASLSENGTKLSKSHSKENTIYGPHTIWTPIIINTEYPPNNAPAIL